VPIRRHGSDVGNVYLGKRPGAAPFTAEDQAAVELLVTHAAIAIENARLYDQLQAAVRAREDVLAVVSHDLRGPLGAILLRAQSVARERDPHRLVTHAEAIRRAADSMQQLIHGLLDEAKLEAGPLRLDIGPARIAELVAATVETFSPIASHRRVRLESSVPDMAPIACDRDRVLQILANLVTNAVKFTPAGGAVSIKAERRDTELVVVVSDTGIGIDAESLPHIFERYFTTARGQGGTGLGLYIVKGLVEAHGGRIWVDTQVGKGTTFCFTLPIGREATVQSHALVT
jgi:signal transduction histidine kinase